jgi:hypothetical protein
MIQDWRILNIAERVRRHLPSSIIHHVDVGNQQLSLLKLCGACNSAQGASRVEVEVCVNDAEMG